jgi:hypothetical protein
MLVLSRVCVQQGMALCSKGSIVPVGTHAQHTGERRRRTKKDSMDNIQCNDRAGQPQ